MRPAATAQLGERLDVPSTVHRHKNGDELAVSLTVAPIPNGADEPTGAVVVTRDIGEPQRAETRQRESEAKYRALTEHLPTITYVHPLGERGAPLYVSPQVGAILGYAADEWLAKPNSSSSWCTRTTASASRPRSTPRRRGQDRFAASTGCSPGRPDRLGARRGGDGARRRRPAAVRPGLPARRERAAARRRGAERLLAAERAAAAEALDRQRKLDVLARAGEILASSPNFQATPRRVADLAVRDLADCVSSISWTTTARRPASQPRTPAPAAPRRRAGARPEPESSRSPARQAELTESRHASHCGPGAARSVR